ncbi:MAG: 50S ribosomal protein L29 [Bacteroidetes bacterium]|nr:50S ribosomal protein L29 [Bacteroidota bacterium]
MKPQVIRELSTKDLGERLEEEKKQLARLKINHAVSPLDNPTRIKAVRRDIARMTFELCSRTKVQAVKNDNQ